MRTEWVLMIMVLILDTHLPCAPQILTHLVSVMSKHSLCVSYISMYVYVCTNMCVVRTIFLALPNKLYEIDTTIFPISQVTVPRYRILKILQLVAEGLRPVLQQPGP